MEFARDAAKAEWYVGTRGGEMDHITMALAKRDHAVLISYLEQQTRHVALPGRQFRWITFFSKAADKGREVMIEYNERAAVSRIVLPALIEGWKTKEPERYTYWVSAIRSLEIGATGALDEIETLLQELPPTLTLSEMGRDYPAAFDACARSFPLLVAERVERRKRSGQRVHRPPPPPGDECGFTATSGRSIRKVRVSSSSFIAACSALDA